nr:restriction endonuclease subunit S [Frateuria flava]
MPRYPEYKESGVNWLGPVPGHWAVQRLGYHFAERREKVSDEDFAPLSITRNGVVPQLEHVAKTDDGANRKKVCRGDFVINGRSDRKGSSGASDYDGSCSLINIVLVPGPEIDIRFAHHLLRSVPFQEEFYRYGKGIVADLWSTNFSEMKNISLAVPPMVEQRVIATFLDRETAKIDALIAEQEKLLALLAEKRQATISHAVTRGLNPNAPMKDSGIPWLGEVPAHWRVTKCGRFLSVLSGYAFPSAGFDHNGNGTKLLRGVNVSVGSLRWDDVVYWERSTDDGLDEYELQVGDLVIGMDRPLIAAGMRVAKVKEEDVPCLLLQRVALLRTSSELNSDFLMHWLSTPMFVAHFSPETTGVSVPHISPDQIASFVIALPPNDEQRKIIEFLDEELGRLTRLCWQSEQAVQLLKERRSALISAAVTGKIDVRHAA